MFGAFHIDETLQTYGCFFEDEHETIANNIEAIRCIISSDEQSDNVSGIAKQARNDGRTMLWGLQTDTQRDINRGIISQTLNNEETRKEVHRNTRCVTESNETKNNNTTESSLDVCNK